jgi:prepilin-type N-terminal cleavage/methylation domain-containing protein
MSARFVHRGVRRGFTLMECAITTVIIGVAIVAVIELLANGNRASATTVRTLTAMHLAQDIREYTIAMRIDALDALNGESFSPPLDARGTAIAEMPGWQQTISVTGADENRLTLTVPVASTDMRRVTVTVSHRGNTVASSQWLVADTSD